MVKRELFLANIFSFAEQLRYSQKSLDYLLSLELLFTTDIISSTVALIIES